MADPRSGYGGQPHTMAFQRYQSHSCVPVVCTWFAQGSKKSKQQSRSIMFKGDSIYSILLIDATYFFNITKKRCRNPWVTKIAQNVAVGMVPELLGGGNARKSRLTVPRVTFGCGTVRRHRSRRARRRPLLLSLGGQGVSRMVVRPLYPAYSFDIWKFLLFLS